MCFPFICDRNLLTSYFVLFVCCSRFERVRSHRDMADDAVIACSNDWSRLALTGEETRDLTGAAVLERDTEATIIRL